MIDSMLALLAHDFLRHALVAGTAIAALSGLVGYFVVLRGQTFVGDMLSHVAYTGAIAALAIGLDLRLGLFAATLALAVGVGLLGGRASADDVIIGNAMAWVLGLGVFFLAIYTGSRASGNSGANAAVLFGSIFGISAQEASLASWIAAGLIVVLLVIARPLMFASFDPSVAAASGVPTRLLGPVFLAVVGATAAEATQAVGALLLVGLLAAPPAAAQRLTNRPWVALWLSGVLAVAAMWVGLAAAYAVPTLPPSFTIMAAAAFEYALAAVLGPARARVERRVTAPTPTPT